MPKELQPQIKAMIVESKDKISFKLTYLSDSLMEAIKSSFKSFADRTDLLDELGHQHGTILISGHVSLSYDILFSSGEWQGYICGWYQNGLAYFYSSDNLDWRSGLDDYPKDKRIWSLFIILLFLKYAQIETVYLPAGQKVKGINCKYVNDSKFNINHIDSRWFTTLVKSDGFKVRGHFRLQPKKKDGSWTKELIWINDFMKSGYTAPAQKLSHHE